MELLLNIIELGLIFSALVLGVFFTSRLVQLDDLTLEGSFNIGGAICAFLILKGCLPWLALLIALLAGLLSGIITGILHTRFGINHLISGLAMTTALYSFSLKIASAHLVIAPSTSIFANGLHLPSWLLLLAIALLLMGALHLFLRSEIGLLVRAVGCNRQLLSLLGKDAALYQIMGLSLANGLCALSGALFVQWLGFYSITNYIGTWITGLNGLMLAEMVSLPLGVGLLLGSILNQGLFAVVIEWQVDPLWNQALKAVLVLTLLHLSNQKKMKLRNSHVAA